MQARWHFAVRHNQKHLILQPDSEDLFEHHDAADIEDLVSTNSNRVKGQIQPIKRKRGQMSLEDGSKESQGQDDLSKSWRDILGAPPKEPTTMVNDDYIFTTNGILTNICLVENKTLQAC